MSKAKRFISATFLPYAQCTSLRAPEKPCQWSAESGPSARDEAKAHAETFPGHIVEVVTQTVDQYKAEA